MTYALTNTNTKLGSKYLIYHNGLKLQKESCEFSILAPREHNPKNIIDPNTKVFTTLTTQTTTSHLRNQAIGYFRLKQHISRLLSHADGIGITSKSILEHQAEWIENEVIKQTKEILLELQNHFQRIITRLVLNRNGFELYLSLYNNPWENSSKDENPSLVRLLSIQGERPLPKLKSTQTAISISARKFAESHGYQEALLLDSKNCIRECAWSNLFWIDHSGRLHTTKENILEGITRGAILELADCSFTELTLTQLLQEAAEVFITQSTSGITRVSAIDKHHFELSAKNSKFENLKLLFQNKINSETVLL